MKKFLVITLVALALFVLAPSPTAAQAGAKQGPDVVRDPDMEKDSLHNLEVARQYFTLRKAYKASLARCEEIIAGNPTFSKIDEVLWIAGESSLRLSANKGKQSVKTATDKLRGDARDYLSMLVNSYPDSRFKGDAMEELKSLGGPLPKDNSSKQ
jgi:outer membrane protein assembly factor BamD (BamD/ComL family)